VGNLLQTSFDAIRTRARGERGAALIETAMTLPLLLLVSAGIFEFGRAYQTWQVLTNAAREGARMAVLSQTATGDVTDRVRSYLEAGQLSRADDATIVVNRNTTLSIGATTATGSQVTVQYPFSFMVLQPVAGLVVHGSTLGGEEITLSASAEMRNEAQ
jgi:Flp pilus assembly protein TadG